MKEGEEILAVLIYLFFIDQYKWQMLNILLESFKIDVHLKIVIKSKFDTIFLIPTSSFYAYHMTYWIITKAHSDYILTLFFSVKNPPSP
jgi:hypothetical protein